MNDRLSELKGGGNEQPIDATRDIELGHVNEKNIPGAFMKDVFEQVEAVKSDLEIITDTTKQLAIETGYSAVYQKAEDEVKAKRRIQGMLVVTNRHVAHAKGSLHALTQETKKLSCKGTSKEAEIRIRKNLQNALTQKFVDIAKEYEKQQDRYKQLVKDNVKRTIRAVKPSVTDQELEVVFQQEDGVSRVLEAAVLKEGDPIHVANVLKEVQDTYEDVRKLESSIIELHNMFMDLALLVEQQGEKLDQIEYQVKEAGEHVNSANEQIIGAIQKAKVIRKRQCCMIVIVLIIIAIIVVVVVVLKSGN
eukprot:401210_1